MSKKLYSIQDLIDNPDFKKWALRGHKDKTKESDQKSSNLESTVFWDHLENNPDHSKQIAFAKELLTTLQNDAHALSDQHQQRIWKSIKLKHEDDKVKMLPAQKQRKLNNEPKISILKVYAVAASVIILALIVFTLKSSPEPTSEQLLSESPLLEKSTNRGQKLKIFLSDGSMIYLNSESRVAYDKEFMISHRTLKLEGEAFFEVSENAKLPFIVNTSNVSTMALGTSFNIMSESSKISILLVEGKLKIDDNVLARTVYLNDNEMVVNHEERGFSEVQDANNSNDIFWKDGIIVFEETPVSEIVRILEKWYDVNINVTGDPGTLTYSSKYDNETLINVLESMAFSLEIDYSLEEKNVELNF